MEKDMVNCEKGFTLPKERIIYRVKFTKGEEVKYIGHLDVMRTFQRAIKRANFPIAYSHGFNPHQLLSFASPLTLGTTSCGEYGDFEFTEKVDTEEIKERFNAVLPEGIKVLKVVLLKNGVAKAMASIEAATYEAKLDDRVTSEMIDKNLEGYLAQKEINVMKKTKKNFKETNIREDIFEVKNISDDEGTKLFMFLAAGSKRNLKPESVVDGLYQYLGIEFDKYEIRYKRIETFRKENDKYMGLAEGVEAL